MSALIPSTDGSGSQDNLSADQLLNLPKDNAAAEKTVEEPAAAAVLNYLRKRGLGSAAIELQKHLDEDTKRLKTATDSKDNPDDVGSGVNDTTNDLKRLEEKSKEMESVLTVTTGGGFGYDLDAAPAIASWGEASFNGKVHISRRENGEQDSTLEDKTAESEVEKSRQNEAKRYVRGFTALQTWVLALPDDDLSFLRSPNMKSGSISLEDRVPHVIEDVPLDGLKTLLDHADPPKESEGKSVNSVADSNEPSDSIEEKSSVEGFRTASFIPPSVKPELVAITFPLLVHTYCDLLENGLEASAATLLATYRHIHEGNFPTEFRDLDKCSTSDCIRKLNNIVLSANETLSKAKNIRLGYDKCKNALKSGTNNVKLVQQIEELEKQYKNIVEKHTNLLRVLKKFPFLKRVRSVKWHLNLSSSSFSFLARYLRSNDALLPMTALLQTRCHMIVESREPSSLIPTCILDDIVSPDENDTKESKDKNSLRWAAPVQPSTRSNELGALANSTPLFKDRENYPFPNYYLKDEYDTASDYEKDKKRVTFNRKLLSNGFRRLAALEVKKDYEAGLQPSSEKESADQDVQFGNSLEPSTMLSTLCKITEDPPVDGLEYPSIGLTCAKICPPDGRRVAAGCDDSAVRIWSMDSWTSFSGKGTVDSPSGVSSKESVLVLLGHKRGMPVFDVDWNKDGRTLISAGGDGSLRLWDTMAVGSYGEIAQVKSKTTKPSVPSLYTSDKPSTHVPGMKPESTATRHGSALVCYQGHAPSKPVWSVSIAPCGYYFASAGSDSTVRMWCTDRPTPVRVFAGHYSENVNCVSWHPNCNYLVSGSDDKTVRMWDVQSGNCVRVLSGCSSGVNVVETSPSGQFVAGADLSGVVHVWDLRNGKKLSEFQHQGGSAAERIQAPAINSISFSPCGKALATGSQDSTIRIWDARGLGNNSSNPEYAAMVSSRNNSSQILDPRKGEVSAKPACPCKIFSANKTSILDLKYTKRNLLLAVGKYCGSQ
eukprot:CAMPEP_0194099978 /NCGR_PEP_ID=MMETSP0150-20130528/1017_1 /TAXON_ID=122233 /ORGANISM="Chaetoceros debilis, Strain MM31A-1" /LENGTH=996 /DNA_ID=CAMNT_0038786281 /DNA_START=216 /DNA_END=3206 /DNA_ORIENTATION=+